MAEVLVQDSSLQDIADAIREKNGTETTYKPSEMGDAVRGISGGGGGGVPPEALVLTGDCSYRFAYNGWNWFLEEYGDQISLQLNITCSSGNMFYNSNGITEIPFELSFRKNATGISYNISFDNMFHNCVSLKSIPKIYNDYSNITNFDYVFAYCDNLKTIDDSWGNLDFSYLSENNYGSFNQIFNGCNKLIEIPQGLITNTVSKSTSPTNYSQRFYNCYNLNKIQKLGVQLSHQNTRSNMFTNTFYNNRCLKEMTFNLQEDNTPFVLTTWVNQTIDLSRTIGYWGTGPQTDVNEEYKEHKVIDDVTYNQYKNEEYWFTEKVEYSRYNHDSAVNTINSLPDVSSGTGNTIKFKGEAGSATDGGAINTLTEEEIAVASAKGWTVTLV